MRDGSAKANAPGLRSTSAPSLLVIAGEPSGDRAAARVVAELGARSELRAFGLAGTACERAGVELCAHAAEAAAMGALDVARRAGRLVRAMQAVRNAVAMRRPSAALLVNYTEFNARLLGFLRRKRVKIVWYAAPQIWAWRASRGNAIARGTDVMAVILPFEEALWRARGADARYVGHPAMEIAKLDRADARVALALDRGNDAPAIAILPGSRPREVHRLLPAMLATTASAPHRARVLLTRALDDETRAWAHARAREAHVAVHEVTADAGAPTVLAAFDAALCASGTASLECAMAGVPPVVAYRLDALAAFIAKRALRTPHVALPNVLLGRRAFPELLQDDACAERMRDALGALIANRARALDDCAEVRRTLGEGHVPSRAVADMIAPWL